MSIVPVAANAMKREIEILLKSVNPVAGRSVSPKTSGVPVGVGVGVGVVVVLPQLTIQVGVGVGVG